MTQPNPLPTDSQELSVILRNLERAYMISPALPERMFRVADAEKDLKDYCQQKVIAELEALLGQTKQFPNGYYGVSTEQLTARIVELDKKQ